MATLNKAVFDKDFFSEEEFIGLSNEEIIQLVKDNEEEQICDIYSIDDYNLYKSQGSFIDCFVFDVYL